MLRRNVISLLIFCRIDVKSGKKEVLVSPEKEIEGSKNTLTNSVAVDKKGKAYYFTTSSTR